MDILQHMALLSNAKPSSPPQNTILGGTVVANDPSSTGGFTVKGSGVVGNYDHINVPASVALAPAGAGVVMVSPGNDGQDLSILGISGYYYPT
jgi:hypothetical protein